VTLNVTYDDTEALGRVQLTFSGYASVADYALVERSLDLVTWETVRGGETVPLSGGAGHIDDYEYAAGVLNHYRVTAVDTSLPTFVSAGTGATGNNASVSPGLPAGVADGNLMVLSASIRNSATGTVNTPAGWSLMTSYGNVSVFGRYRVTGDTAPTVTFAGGAAGDDTIARIVAFTNADIVPLVVSPQLNASAQDIATPATTTPDTGRPTIATFVGWKQDDWTSIGPRGSFTHAWDTVATAGNDAGMTYDYRIEASGSLVWPTASAAVTGGAAAISRAIMMVLGSRSFTNQETGSITPVMLSHRLKNPSRPSLNVKIEVVSRSPITRRARTGTFDVLNRTLPVAVTDVQSSQEFTIELDVFGTSSAADMDKRLASGEPLFLQARTPTGHLPTMYFVCKDVEQRQDVVGSDSITFTVPMTEVAKPGSAIYGDTTIWNDVVSDFATWSAVLAAEPTWADLIDRISDTEVIVP
jgi:hypothetical protein